MNLITDSLLHTGPVTIDVLQSIDQSEAFTWIFQMTTILKQFQTRLRFIHIISPAPLTMKNGYDGPQAIFVIIRHHSSSFNMAFILLPTAILRPLKQRRFRTTGFFFFFAYLTFFLFFYFIYHFSFIIFIILILVDLHNNLHRGFLQNIKKKFL